MPNFEADAGQLALLQAAIMSRKLELIQHMDAVAGGSSLGPGRLHGPVANRFERMDTEALFPKPIGVSAAVSEPAFMHAHPW